MRSRVHNNDIHEILNNNYGFPNADDSDENVIPFGRVRITQDAESITLCQKILVRSYI